MTKEELLKGMLKGLIDGIIFSVTYIIGFSIAKKAIMFAREFSKKRNVTKNA